jgi:hypothetical protein
LGGAVVVGSLRSLQAQQAALCALWRAVVRCSATAEPGSPRGQAAALARALVAHAPE